MDTKDLMEAIAELAALDPAQAPDEADRITEMLAELLEASDDGDSPAT